MSKSVWALFNRTAKSSLLLFLSGKSQVTVSSAQLSWIGLNEMDI